jgi:8-oxoguanine deaminase
MKTLLIKNADVLVTMDAQRREIKDGAVFVRGNVIEAVGTTAELPQDADEVIDARGEVVMPGLVNTHHHMYQSLTRAVGAAQDSELFGWLQTLYPIWANLTPEMIRVSTQTAMAELMLSGCTTSSDHLYIYPNGIRLDDSIEAADAIGMRFHAARGAMSVGQSQGGLPPDSVVEREDAILEETQRLIRRWHDPSRHAMRRIVVAPCSPFSVSRELMRDAALLAREYGVSLHTHPGRKRQRHRLHARKVQLHPGRIRAGPGLDRPRRLARPLREAGRRRHLSVCAHRHWRGALPLLQHAAGLRHCAHPQND